MPGDGDNWYVVWTFNGAEYFLTGQYIGTTPDPNDPTLLVDYSYGHVETSATGGSLFSTDGTATGHMDVAKNLIFMTGPKSGLGAPPANAVLTGTGALTLRVDRDPGWWRARSLRQRRPPD